MSLLMIAFLTSMGAGAWLYSKFYNRSGGNRGPAITGAAIIASILFLILYLTLITIFKN